jgi:hypothetical protein
VLTSGETGAGKELGARGAFTDTHACRPGLITQAAGGTPPLDEVDTPNPGRRRDPPARDSGLDLRPLGSVCPYCPVGPRPRAYGQHQDPQLRGRPRSPHSQGAVRPKRAAVGPPPGEEPYLGWCDVAELAGKTRHETRSTEPLAGSGRSLRIAVELVYDQARPNGHGAVYQPNDR